jgi:chromosome segregation ATPase
MKRPFLYFVVAAMSGVCFSSFSVCAQEPSSIGRIEEVETLGSADWQKTIDDTKKEIKDLLQENQRLTEEYDFLREKLSSLQTKVLELKQAVDEKKRSNEALEQFQNDQGSLRTKMKKDIEAMKREAAGIENEKALLLNQLKEEEKKTELWQLKLSDLQVKKRELTLELKLQEISRQELEQGQDEELEKLKVELAAQQEQEKLFEKELRSLQNESKKAEPEIDKAILTNKEMEAKIASVKAQYEAQKRTNEELAKKNEELKKKAEAIPADLILEKKTLDADIQKLEKELADVRKSIEGSADLMQKKSQLMNEIMRMDSENQELRKQIDDLMQGNAAGQ